MASCQKTGMSVQSYENCGAPPQGLFGYPGPFTAPGLDAQFTLVAQRNKPPGAPSGFAIVCEACLRARGLIYQKSSPGDCPRPAAPGSLGSGQIVGLSGMAASGVVGGLGAAGILSGTATFGIGTAVSLSVAGIEAIFQHHAQAVQTEQTTICAVAGYFNPLLRQIDAAVQSGEITDQEGIAYVIDVTNQAISGLGSIYKPCNAACVYQAILRAHADFVKVYYPLLSPGTMFMPQAPGQAPITYFNPPGAVPDAGARAPIRATDDPGFAYRPTILASAAPLTPNSLLPSGCSAYNCPDYLNGGYNQQTGQSAQYADVPPTSINWVMWGAIAAIVAAFVAILAVSR